MTNLPPTALTELHARTRAAAIICGALSCSSMTASALVETVDLVSATVLQAAGLSRASARMVLAALWEHSTRVAAAADSGRQLRISDREREFLRDLGERVRMLRGGRRLHAAHVAQATRIPADQLGDLERGYGIPSVLALYRLAEVLEVPLPLLVDDTKTPLDLLRAVAGMRAARTDPRRR